VAGALVLAGAASDNPNMTEQPSSPDATPYLETAPGFVEVMAPAAEAPVAARPHVAGASASWIEPVRLGASSTVILRWQGTELVPDPDPERTRPAP
jgi:hypothetical protein